MMRRVSPRQQAACQQVFGLFAPITLLLLYSQIVNA
jgi:hypothetical protein